jgi:potassium/hydrogen antiporter
LPEKTLAVMVKRNGKYFVPGGKTELTPDDKLLIITDDHEALKETMKNLGLADKPASS